MGNEDTLKFQTDEFSPYVIVETSIDKATVPVPRRKLHPNCASFSGENSTRKLLTSIAGMTTYASKEASVSLPSSVIFPAR